MQSKQLKGKQITNESIAKLRASALTGHDDMDTDMGGRAQAMLTGGGSSAFGADSMMLGNIKGLMGVEEPVEDGEGEAKLKFDEEDEHDGSDDEDEPQQPTPKKAKFVNQDKLALEMTRALEKELENKDKSLKELKEKLGDQITKLEAANITEKAFFRSELALVRPRYNLVVAALQGEDAL